MLGLERFLVLFTRKFLSGKTLSLASFRSSHSRIALAALFLAKSNCDLVSLDDSKPFLSASGRAIEWHGGGPAFLLSRTPILRVNSRGVFTEKKHAKLRQDLPRLGWARFPCNFSAVSLCRAQPGEVFPLLKPVAGEGSLPHGFDSLRCSDSQGKLRSAASEYHVSACDIVDEGLDVVFSDQLVWIKNTKIGTAEYVLYLVLATFLVRGLSVNLQKKQVLERQAYVVGASLACCALCLVDGDSPYVTESDQLFFWCTLLYCLAYSAYHIYQLKTEPSQRPVFNLIAGTLQLVSTRLYAGSETPYNPAVLFIIGARAFEKLKSAEWGQAGTAILDACYLSLMCELAFVPDPRFLVPVFLASYLYAV